MEKPTEYTLTWTVTDEMTAKRIGGAGSKILSTPNMVALMEAAALELAKAKADRKELEADMQAKEKVSKEKSEKLDALEEQVARLTSMSPDDRVTARNEANAQARADVDSECQAVFVAVMGLASRCAAVMQDERSTDETCMWIHKRVSVLANSVAEALLGAGIDVDLRAYLELPQDDGTDMNDNRE